MAWRGHDVAAPPSPPSPPLPVYDEAAAATGTAGLDDLAVAALATLPPQKAASILTKLRNKGRNVRNPSAYVARSVENAHCHGSGGSLRPQQPPPGAVYYVPYYNYGPPPPPNESPPGFEGFAPSPAAPAFVPQGVPYEAPGLQPTLPSSAEDESDATDDGEQKDPCDALDPKASAALANLPEKEADRILDNLRRKGDAVRNPSAYVMRSILNSHAECAYPSTDELPDIEEVPQAALQDAAACAICLECNEVCNRKVAIEEALRAAPVRESGCSIVFATRGSAAVQAWGRGPGRCSRAAWTGSRA